MNKQNKDAERSFFDGLAGSGERFKPKAEEAYSAILGILGLERDLSCMNILEAGCASGEFGVRLARRGAVVTGVDLSPGMIELNHRLNEGVEHYTAHTGDLEDPELFDAETFDAVICFNVLHHFPDCGQVIDNFARWLKDKGEVFCEEPNGGNPTNRISKAGRAVVNAVFPRFLHDKKLSSENEERDYTMAEYEDLFGARSFECRFKSSVGKPGLLPKLHGISIATPVSVVKWGLYHMTAAFTDDPVVKGQDLVFRMRKNAG